MIGSLFIGFSGSDMALFNQFPEYFGATEINKIETTYRFGEPLVSLSSNFIQRNKAQIQKNIHSFSSEMRTELEFYAYDRRDYCNTIGQLVASIPSDKSIFLLGRYSLMITTSLLCTNQLKRVIDSTM